MGYLRMLTMPNLKDSKPAPKEAIAYCRGITAHHSKTFYFGSCFFPFSQRQAVWAVYAACRLGDDTVDELSGQAARDALEIWRVRVENAIAGQPDQNPMAQGLAWAASQYPISYEPFHELYLGLEMDLVQHHYQTLEELMLYCRRVAGVVGWMITPIAGFEGGQATLEQALKLGMAMQITNILRDVGEDLDRGRIYLPLDLMAKHGVTVFDLEQRRVTPNYIALMRELDCIARQLYREGWKGLPHLHGAARVAVAVAAKSYEAILGALELNGFDNFNKRAHISGQRKLAMIPTAYLELQRTRHLH
jgi:15-cis-phytoene synthase